ncbi:phosphatase PAP2 family protein [Enterovirga sp. DB1703]|uniref:Phosphatase PAP2 family protein n=1 Tax=Enterovirga aerilata TaxID=2730920 RepID=A0A849I3C9_9HYPH|nr:phosphatase PAP2 family protein [Enterovirga sp. DB1703]
MTGVAFGIFLKKTFGFIRPHHAPMLGEEAATSFPSGHALLASLLLFSIAFAVLRCASPAGRFRVGALAFGSAAALSLLVGLSRVHLGLHWPTDVVAGWAAGAGWALLFSLVFVGQKRELASGAK